jgi:hypothetical protein
LPVVDKVSADYADRVSFLAVAWRGSMADTTERAGQLLRSGNIKWGLDEDERIFGLYGVPYQPVTVMIGTDKTVVDAWAGALEEDQLRAKLDALVAS